MDPENNPITYQLTNGSTSAMYFRFEGNTIKVNVILDREAIATHTFTVLAVDNGQPPKMGFALVSVIVIFLDVEEGSGPITLLWVTKVGLVVCAKEQAAVLLDLWASR